MIYRDLLSAGGNTWLNKSAIMFCETFSLPSKSSLFRSRDKTFFKIILNQRRDEVAGRG